MHFLKLTRLPVVIVVMVVLAACTAAQPEGGGEPAGEEAGEPIIFGIAAGYSGILEGFDVPAATGAEIAIDELNASGGILGRPIEVVTADTKSDINQGSRAGLEVIEQGADVMLVTPDFNFGGGAAREAQNAGIVAISMGAGSPKFGVEGIGTLAFTMGMPGSTDGAIMAEWGYEQGFRTAYLLLDDVTDYDKDQCRGFQERWEALGGEILGSDTFKNSDTSVAPQVSRISALAAEPDYICLCSFPPGGAVAVKQLRDAGIDSAIIGNGAFDGDFWFKDSIPGLSDFYFVTSASIWGNDPSEEVNAFVENFTEKTGERPQNIFAYFGYAAVHMLARAIERAGTTEGEAVASALESFAQESVAGILISYTDGTHIDTMRQARVIQVDNGVHSVVEVRPVQEAPPLFEE